jgi:hypothetical protein
MRRPSHRAPGPARSSRPARCAWAARKPRICSRCSTRRTARSAASTRAWPSSSRATSWAMAPSTSSRR